VATGYATVAVEGGANTRFGLARYNADGSLDQTFDGDGKATTVTTTTPGFHSIANASAILPDGRIVVAGYTFNYASGLDFTVVRYNANGSPDNTFDTDGIVLTDFLMSSDSAQATAIQPDGKIVAAGLTGNGNGNSDDFAVARYNPNGSLDTSFDTDGKTTTDMGFPVASGAGDVAAQADGRIVVAGYAFNGFNDDFAILRYNADGTRDQTFGSGGKVLTDISTFAQGERAKAIAIQADGKIVAAGQTVLGGTGSDFALVRYNADGSRDQSFDGDGIVTTDLVNNSYDLANAVAVQPDGKIVAVGVSAINGNFDFALARYNPDGSLDTTFDGDGKVTTVFSQSSDNAYAVVIQTDGRIVVAGNVSNGTSDFALARYNADGSLDTSFDADGKVSTDIAGTNDGAASLALQADGRIVAAGGVVFSGAGDYALVRYNPDGSLDQSFDGDGKVWNNVSGGDIVGTVAIQTDGRIVVAGSSAGDASLARYNQNGSLDQSFGAGGTRVFDMGGAGNDLMNGMTLDAAGRIVIAGETSPSLSNPNISIARILTAAAPRRAPFDFDGDGRTDLSIFRPAGGEWWYLRSSDGGNAAFGFGNSSDKLVPADYTGDGNTDIAVFRPATGEWFVLRSEEVSYYSFPFGASGDVPAPADFDGDGKADAAVFRPSNSTWYIRRSSDGAIVIRQFGQTGDAPVAVDYDGDGKADIAVWRASAGQWWLNRSTAGVIAYGFGNSADKPVQGDYTGDGKADVAIFRPSTNEWFVLRSENVSYYSFAFGASGDVIAPGDYDGDGKFDATVFRPSGSTWYSNRTTAGTLIQSFGQTGDRPVPNVFVP
jgi:uncharacterized delta-60 repeat protein